MELKTILQKMEGTYSGAAAVQTAPALNLEQVKLELDEVTRSGRYVAKEKEVVKLVPPEKTTEE